MEAELEQHESMSRELLQIRVNEASKCSVSLEVRKLAAS